MTIFTLLLTKLIPLYAMIVMGYIAGKKLGVSRDSVGVIVLYLLVPLIMLSGVIKADITPATLLLPLIAYGLSAALCIAFLWLNRRIWQDGTPNILACAAGTGNTGYFGLPVAIALFDEKTVAIYIILILGVTIFESTLGMYIAAKGHYSAKEAFTKVLRIPTIYAFFLGLLFHILQVPMPAVFWDFIGDIRGAYIVLGMMIIGLGLAAMPHFKLDFTFISMAFLAKFVAWPAAVFSFIWLDNAMLHLYTPQVHQALILLAIVPMPANSVVIATLFNTHPEKTASAVLLSTLLAIIYVPWMVAHFLQ